MNKVTIYVCNKEYKVDKELWYSIENLINKYINNIINLQQRIDKAIELIEQDYFEDGSGEYIEQVLSILRGEE